MNPTTPDLDRVFPLCGGSSERARLRAPRLFLGSHVTPRLVMGHGAFLRALNGRRAATSAPVTAARPTAMNAATSCFH